MEKDNVAKQIAENLAEIIGAKGVSNAQLAKTCDITRSTVSKILNADINISAQMLVKLARGLNIEPNDLLNGLVGDVEHFHRSQVDPNESLYVGILSIDKKRMTCIKNHCGDVVGMSELDSDLDLAETTPQVFKLIELSIKAALVQTPFEHVSLRQINVLAVVQSYEFMQTRKKFEDYAKRYFQSIKLIPDWQITYLSAFGREPGICLVVDKGVSLSYMHERRLHKIWGWKFPVYDVGGENWLGVQAIRHTVEAEGGFVPMTDLARTILTKHGGLIENILEACFKKEKDPDVYCRFSELLMRCYFTGDPKAREIIERGFRMVYRAINKVDEITRQQLPICMHGSLADIYQTFIKPERLLDSAGNVDKAKLLADVVLSLCSETESSVYAGIIF